MDSIEHTVVRTRKPRGQGASRRGEILAAAKRLFVEDGVQHVTMRRLAAEVGVSATALYVYFPDKDAILQAIAAEHFAALLVELESCIRPDRATPDNLRAGLRAFAAFGLAHRDEYRLTFIRSGRRDGIDPCEKLAEADSSFAILLQTVEKMIDEGYFASKIPAADRGGAVRLRPWGGCDAAQLALRCALRSGRVARVDDRHGDPRIIR